MRYVVPELLEEILLRLPLRSILRFKTVSTQWRSILESKRFAERRRRMSNHQQIPKILAVRDDRTESQFQGNEEVKMVYLQCEAAATQLSMTCDGLVCIPIPGYVNVWNPCTGELLNFPSGPNPVNTSRYDRVVQGAYWWDFFPGYWAMGFGKDKVNGSYKIVRMFYDTDQFEILDLNISKWRTLLNPPPYYVEARHHSAFVNGSIYWFELLHGFKILALDLHTEQFHDVPTPRASPATAPLVNLEDRLAMVCGYGKYSDAKVDIWTMDTQEETWTKTYSIRLFPSYLCPNHVTMKCIPLMVSKQGNIYFHDSEKKLFKYYPETDQVCCIAKHICVLSPFVENMIPLGHPKTMAYPPGFQYADSWISKLCRRIELLTTILLSTTVVALVIFRLGLDISIYCDTFFLLFSFKT